MGIFTATDVLRLAVKRADLRKPLGPPLPNTCAFQVPHRRPDGTEATCCILPSGVCPLQLTQKGEDGREQIVCSQPHCVLTDWQIVDVEKLPKQERRQDRTANPVTSGPAMPIRDLALRMLDAHIHRLVVVDEGQRPVGMVSTTDILQPWLMRKWSTKGNLLDHPAPPPISGSRAGKQRPFAKGPSEVLPKP